MRKGRVLFRLCVVLAICGVFLYLVKTGIDEFENILGQMGDLLGELFGHTIFAPILAISALSESMQDDGAVQEHGAEQQDELVQRDEAMQEDETRSGFQAIISLIGFWLFIMCLHPVGIFIVLIILLLLFFYVVAGFCKTSAECELERKVAELEQKLKDVEESDREHNTDQ